MPSDEVAALYEGTNMELLPQQLQKLLAVAPGKYERVGYYRSPDIIWNGEPYEQAGWITWSDTQPNKRNDFMVRGFMPLPMFGYITDTKDPWGPLFRHARGAAQLPVDQILARRFYDHTVLRKVWPSAPRKFVKDKWGPFRLFTQLVSEQVEIKEYECPQCRKRVFPTPRGLFGHLGLIHTWSPEDIFKYGQHRGIDFSRDMAPAGIRDLNYADMPADDVEDDETDALTFNYPVERVAAVHPQAAKSMAARGQHPPEPAGRSTGRPRDARGRLLPGKPAIDPYADQRDDDAEEQTDDD